MPSPPEHPAARHPNGLPPDWEGRTLGNNPYGAAPLSANPGDWSEKDFQQEVVDLAKERGWLVYHPYDSRRSEAGYPDLTMVHPVHGIIWGELKSRDGKVTDAQQAWLAALRDAGQRAYLWRPVDWPSIVAVLLGYPMESVE